MLKVVICLIFALSSTFAFENSDEFINEINRKQNLWTAGRNFHKDTPISYIRSLMGWKSLPQKILETIPVVTHEIDDDDLPDTFDARTRWPKCKTISEIADQSSCGSCWAVSVASSISDRICIHSDGKSQPEISAKNLMSCSTESHGCEGGYSYYAWLYWTTQGIVTGGPYGSKIGCLSYPFAPCEHFIDGPKNPCSIGVFPTPKCVKVCDNSTMNYSNDLIYGASAYKVPSDERQIRKEIMKNGPVVAGFSLYTDFLSYKSGIYFHIAGSGVGGHAVRIIGWGEEKGTKYWLVMNSWNEDWGEKGTFKIRRGTNECSLEERITAGLPK